MYGRKHKQLIRNNRLIKFSMNTCTKRIQVIHQDPNRILLIISLTFDFESFSFIYSFIDSFVDSMVIYNRTTSNGNIIIIGFYGKNFSFSILFGFPEQVSSTLSLLCNFTFEILRFNQFIIPVVQIHSHQPTRSYWWQTNDKSLNWRQYLIEVNHFDLVFRPQFQNVNARNLSCLNVYMATWVSEVLLLKPMKM